MKKTLKSLLACVLAVLLLVAVVPMDIFVEASAQEFTSGDYTYTVEKGKATIIDVDDLITGKVVIPDTLDGYPVVCINTDAFSLLTEIEEVVIPNSVVSIRYSAFYKCINLKKITIGAGVSSISSEAFLKNTSIESISVDDGNEKYSSKDGVLFNKNKTKLIMFPCGNSATEYVIPDGVKTIGANAFKYCTNLKNIKMPDSLKKIEEYAFSNCEKLTDVKIPDGVTSIGGYAFEKCTSLQDIEIPESVTMLGWNAFYECSNLNSVTFYNPQTEIEWSGCTVPDNAVIYGYRGSTALSFALTFEKEFVLLKNPNKVTAGKCGENLTWEKDDDGTLYIRGKGKMSFLPDEPTWKDDYRDEITTVIIEEGVTSIVDFAFENCINLKSITIPDSVTKIGLGTFFGCSKLEEITLPSGITEISSWMFMDCTSLKNVDIPDSVTVIGGGVFECCSSLKNITIPAAVTTIHGDAFRGCTSLTDVYFLGTQKQWNAIECNDSTMGKENMSGLTDQIIHFANENIKTSDTAKDCIFALEGQTVASLKNTVSCNAKVLDKTSKVVSDKTKLATGMQMVLTDAKGNVLDNVTVVVPGDVDGDGAVKAADARRALRAAVRLDTLSECEETAADLEATSSVHSVNSADARFILRMSVKLEDSNVWLKNLK